MRSTPARSALAVLLCWWLVVAVSGPVLMATTDAGPTTAALVATVLLTALAVALAVRLRHRPGHSAEDLGLVPPSRWRSPGLVVVVLALPLSALVAGTRWNLGVGSAAVLVVGYLLTGFTEELAWRGTVLQLLAPIGRTRSVLVGSALFGAAHLTNVLYRDSAVLVVAQAFGAFCFGVGYAAIRLRTGALPALMVGHLLTDLLPHVGRLPAVPVFVAQDVVLLAVGLVLLRRTPQDVSGPTPVPSDRAGGSTTGVWGRALPR